MAYTVEKLYIIKTFHKNKDDSIISSNDAIFMDLISAIQAVNENECDLSEDGYNQYAMIGEIETGMYPIVDEILWFAWNKESQYYGSCLRPTFTTGMAYTL